MARAFGETALVDDHPFVGAAADLTAVVAGNNI